MKRREVWKGLALGLVLCGAATLPACDAILGPNTSGLREHYLVPTLVASDLQFTSIAASGHHTCATATDGLTYCWGGNPVGELGTDDVMDTCRDGLWGRFPCTGVPTPVDSDVRFMSVVTSGGGAPHTCALSDEGAAYCWGFGLGGQLGDGRNTSTSRPTAVAGGHTFVRLSTSFWSGFTCGITADDEVYCWGVASGGVLGNGVRNTWENVPVRAANELGLGVVSIGDMHACGITPASEAYCWGGNWNGQLGTGTYSADGAAADSWVPVRVSGDRRFRAIAAGSPHTCALDLAGAAYCWGGDRFVGSDRSGNALVPTAVAGGHTFAAIHAGSSSTCGLTAAGTAYCWGENLNATLGDGSRTHRQLPVRVAGTHTFVRLADNPLCALDAAGRAYCWGGNWNGQAGGAPYCSEAAGLC